MNEEGTEAAAATGLLLSLRIADSETRIFHADRPFVFVIFDFDEYIPLFVGKMLDPSREE